MKRLNIVTGGGGFIGLNLVEALLQKDEYVTILDNCSTGYNATGVSDLKHRYPYRLSHINVDVSDAKRLNDALSTPFISSMSKENPIRVYHLAAESHVDRSISDPLGFVTTNVVGTANILELKRRHLDSILLLVVSTDEVYGDGGPFPTPLDAKLDPSNPYSASKAAADLIAQAYKRTYKMGLKLSRSCNNFGKHQHSEKFLPTIIRSIKESKPVPLYGDGKQMRQWVPASVHASRLISLMGDSDLDYQHVGGFSICNKDLIQMVSEILGIEVAYEHVADRPGHDVKYELKDPKAIEEADFRKHLREYIEQEVK
jgi:dTDP-glucose 4,6-dehydratase